MSIAAFKNSLIPNIKRHVGVPVIEADQIGDTPEGPHITYKITMRYGKDRGQAEERGIELNDSFVLSRVESFKRVISFTAYDMDNDASIDLAQAVHDWFTFAGYDYLSMQNMVVVEASSVQNRDAFVLDDYERRNGFDVTLRLTRELTHEVDYIERIDAFEPQPAVELFEPLALTFAFETDGVVDREYTGTIDINPQLIKTDQPYLLAGSATRIGQSAIL